MMNSNTDAELSFENVTFDSNSAEEAEVNSISPPAIDNGQNDTTSPTNNNIFTGKEKEDTTSSPATSSVQNTTLVLKNLPFHLKHDKLLEVLRQNGIYPQYARYHQDASNGAFRGIAFVKYKGVEEAVRAYAVLDGLDVMSRKVRVEFKKKGSTKSTTTATTTATTVAASTPTGDVADVTAVYEPKKSEPHVELAVDPADSSSSSSSSDEAIVGSTPSRTTEPSSITAVAVTAAAAAAAATATTTTTTATAAPVVATTSATDAPVVDPIDSIDTPIVAVTATIQTTVKKAVVKDKEKDEMKKVLLQQLQAFAADESQAQINFPHNLSNSQRKYVHKHADKLGFIHFSQGQSESESARCICVKKKDKHHHTQQHNNGNNGSSILGTSPARSGLAEAMFNAAAAAVGDATPFSTTTPIATAPPAVVGSPSHVSNARRSSRGGENGFGNSKSASNSWDGRAGGGFQTHMREREATRDSSSGPSVNPNVQHFLSGSPTGAARQRSISNTDGVNSSPTNNNNNNSNNNNNNSGSKMHGSGSPSHHHHHLQHYLANSDGSPSNRKRGDSCGVSPATAASGLSSSPPSSSSSAFMRRPGTFGSPVQRKQSTGLSARLSVRQSKGPDGSRGFSVGRGKPLLSASLASLASTSSPSKPLIVSL